MNYERNHPVAYAWRIDFIYGNSAGKHCRDCRNRNGGVFETNPNNLGDSISKILGKTDIKRGVEVLQGKQEGTINITLHVHAVYGNNLLTVAKNIRSGVRSAIESMSGQKVEKIAVYIAGILGTESGSDQARLDKKD